MNDMEERQIQRVRLRLLDLVKSFFLGEPDSEKLSRWRGTFTALTKEQVNATFDAAVAEIATRLRGNTLEALQEEYYKLFTDPFTDKGLHLSASYYLSGRSHGKALVDIRTLIMEAGIERKSDVVETEDSLVVMLDIYARLIEEESEKDEPRLRKLREEMLHGFLLPFSVELTEAAENNEFSDFFTECCRFCRGYLEMERELSLAAA